MKIGEVWDFDIVVLISVTDLDHGLHNIEKLFEPQRVILLH